MKKLSTSVDAVDGMRQITMRVSLKRTTELQWRIWLAMHLIALAAWVLNCRIEFDGDKNGHE